jgi:hypothetical protein
VVVAATNGVLGRGARDVEFGVAAVAQHEAAKRGGCRSRRSLGWRLLRRRGLRWHPTGHSHRRNADHRGDGQAQVAAKVAVCRRRLLCALNTMLVSSPVRIGFPLFAPAAPMDRSAGNKPG